MRKILLDTNAYSSFLGGNQDVLDALAKADIVYLSVFVLGELFAGFKGSEKEAWNKSLLQKFIEKPTVSLLNTTTETAEIFGTIKNALKKEGNPIPINDVWIAAHCLETGSVLVTFDTHFVKISGLRIWKNL